MEIPSDIKKYLKNGKRLSYGARALIKGGLQSMPSMEFPGGYLIGDNAGTLNFSKIKGSHTAMKSGIEAAKVINSNLNGEQKNFDEHLKTTWLYKELYQSETLVHSSINLEVSLAQLLMQLINLFSRKFTIYIKPPYP